MDELIAEPGIFAAIERLDGPVDQLLDAWDPLRIGMVGEPDIERKLDVDVERNQGPGDRRDVGRQPADAGAFRDGPDMRAGDVVAHRDKAELLARGVPVVHLLAAGL